MNGLARSECSFQRRSRPLDGNVTVLNGTLSEVGINVSGINKPLGDVVFLQSLGLDVQAEASPGQRFDRVVGCGQRCSVTRQPA